MQLEFEGGEGHQSGTNNITGLALQRSQPLLVFLLDLMIQMLVLFIRWHH